MHDFTAAGNSEPRIRCLRGDKSPSSRRNGSGIMPASPARVTSERIAPSCHSRRSGKVLNGMRNGRAGRAALDRRSKLIWPGGDLGGGSARDGSGGSSLFLKFEEFLF